MPNIDTKNDSDQRRENDHHDIEKTPHFPDLEDVLPEERAPLSMQTENEKIRNEINTNKDENYSEILNAITEELNNELSGRKHLPTQVTFLDFAGQSMYYAFHQIFLSPKTFYILVVDMTKRLEDKVEEHLDRKGKAPGKHEKLCSRFQSWEYKGNALNNHLLFRFLIMDIKINFGTLEIYFFFRLLQVLVRIN